MLRRTLKYVHVSARRIVHTSVSLSAAGLSAGALAQAPATDDSYDELVAVTGTRIRQPDYVFSNPIVSVDAETIGYSGATNLTNLLQDVPALVNSYDLEDGADTSVSFNAGLNLLNLRSLGVDRTLVLVNGRRHIAGLAGSSAVDLNTIPSGLIERIEVMTGGASAIYGADGVTGVVNVVLKDDFEGFSSRIQLGGSADGGGDDRLVSLLGGLNFGEGRGNITFGLEYAGSESIERDDRDYSRLGQRRILVRNPDDLFDDPDVVDNILSSNVRYIDTSPGGSLYTDVAFGDWPNSPDYGLDYTGDGAPFEIGQQTEIGGIFAIGGSGSLTDAFEDQLIPGLDRFSLNTTARYDINSGHELFAEGKMARTEASFVGQPTFDFFLPVLLDNPYAPDAAVQNASNAFSGLGYIGVARDNFDLGPQVRDIKRETARAVLGVRGDFPFRDWSYEVSYVAGRMKEDNVSLNNRIAERWYAATDAVLDPATDEIVCRSSLNPNALPLFYGLPDFGLTFTPGPDSGCVPADIFGEDISPEARAWITTASKAETEISQNVLQAFVTGDSGDFFSLPAGELEFAAGVEWRRERSDSRASADELLAADLGYDVTWLGQGTNEYGKFQVTEAFAEVSLPLVERKLLVQELTVDVALRTSDYSTSGHASTNKIGALWRVNDFVMVRATDARAIRAPNIGELYLPQTQTFQTLVDPCDMDNVNAGTSFRYNNCQADLGIDPNTFVDSLAQSVEGRIGGNPQLEPETADTTTFGVVLTPRALSRLDVSVDYWNIELKNAINFFEAQTILDKCYDLPAPNQFCPLIQRDPDTGLLESFQEYGVNVSLFEAKGIDFSLRYLSDLFDYGQFELSFVATKLNQLTFVELEDADPDHDVGEPGSPEHQAVIDLTWYYNKLTVNYGLSWFSETDRISKERRAADPDWVDPQFWDYSAREVHDIHVRYDVTDRDISVFGGVNNLTNQRPDPGSINRPVNPFGRYYYFGVQAGFGM